MSDRRSETFQRALDEAARKVRGEHDDVRGSAGRPRMRSSVTFGPAPGSGGEAHFGRALDWTDEPADWSRPQARPSTRETAPHPADTPAEIAAELGLEAAPLTLAELASRWRDFVWRNHPDRQPLEARERATARVAIADTLYDRARRELAKRR